MSDVTNERDEAASVGEKPLSSGELKVEVSEIPLPPEDLREGWDEDPEEAKPDAAKRADQPEKPVASLDYLDTEPGERIVLAHPFRLDGREIREVFVRPLTAIETGKVVEANSPADVYDFYAAMSRLPAPVVRALRGADADSVTEAGYRFLPRFMKGGS